MDLVNVNLYAEAYYSKATYNDNIWIKKSSYEILKEILKAAKVYCREMDGKYGDVYADISFQTDWKTDKDYAEAGNDDKGNGDYLENFLRELYDSNNLDYYEEQKEISDYFNSIDPFTMVTVYVPTSMEGELLAYAKKLQEKWKSLKGE